MRHLKATIFLASLAASSLGLTACGGSGLANTGAALKGSAGCFDPAVDFSPLGSANLVTGFSGLGSTTLKFTRSALTITWNDPDPVQPLKDGELEEWVVLAWPKSDHLGDQAKAAIFNIQGAGIEGHEPAGWTGSISTSASPTGIAIPVRSQVGKSSLVLRVSTHELAGLSVPFRWEALSLAQETIAGMYGSLQDTCPSDAGGSSPSHYLLFDGGNTLPPTTATTSTLALPPTSLPPSTTTSAPPGTATFAPGVPPGLQRALLDYFSTPPNSGWPISELDFGARFDTNDASWAEYTVQGKPAYQQVQNSAGFAHQANGVWTVVAGPGTFGCYPNVPSAVQNFFWGAGAC